MIALIDTRLTPNDRLSNTGSPANSRTLHLQARGAHAGDDGSFDRRGQAGLRPIASERKILQRGTRSGAASVLLRRRGERRSPLADNLPYRQRRLNAGDVRDIVPDKRCQALAVFGGSPA